ncbi:MAG TPA: spermidine synthase [Ruania sp.]|nr:spermidine synthase [Ruania sp.]
MARFEELDFQQTPVGEISLRRRYDLTAKTEIYEVRLGEEYLMSSLFTVAERALATLALAALDRGDLHVLVGGLGLGYTAHTALADPRVADLTVMDAAEPVLDWHRRGLLPEVAGLATDPRCRLVLGDFFSHVAAEPGTRYDAILLDVDHTPRHVLHPSHATFYTEAGLQAMRAHLTAGGVFALWSDDPPDEEFSSTLASVFPSSRAEVVPFANPLTGGQSSNTIYLATAG